MHIISWKAKILSPSHFSLRYLFCLCRIHLGGIISEGNYRGLIEVKPAPYNVVLEDDTYKGQIKIGFRFIPHVSVHEIH